MLERSVILITLFLGKPPGCSLPVISVHSFVVNRQLIFLDQRKRKNSRRNNFIAKSSRKNGTAHAQKRKDIIKRHHSCVITLARYYHLREYILFLTVCIVCVSMCSKQLTCKANNSVIGTGGRSYTS